MLAVMTFVFITGLVVGSFLNVCIYRLPNNQSIVSPPSHCPGCHQRLGVLDLIPVVSYLVQKGKCRYCRVKISPRYLFVELLTGIAFVLIVTVFGFQFQTLLYVLLFCALLTASLIDLDYQIIPDQISLFLVVSGLILQAFGPPGALMNGVIGGLLGGGLLLVLAILSRGGMGGGDVKLITGIGIFLGWQLLLVCLFFSFIIGSLVGLALIIVQNKDMKTAVPFGPFLSAGAIIAIFYGQQIIDKYLTYF